MKHLIEKIEPVSDVVIERNLEWLSKGKYNAFTETSTQEMIRYLIKKVDELQYEIDYLKETVKELK